MIRLLAPAFAVTLLAACAADPAPPSVAELQCRDFAQRATASDFGADTRQRVDEGLDLTTSSPLVFEDIHERACD